MNIELISAAGSNSSERIEWVLNYKGIKFKRTECPEDPRPAYTKVNPMLRVPSMIVDGKPLSESLAMIELVDECFPAPPIYPADPFEKSKVREICEIVNATIHPVQNSKVAQFFIPGISTEDIRSYRRKWIFENLLKLRPLLFKTSSFAYGNSFTLADMLIIPIYRKGISLGMSESELPDFQNHMKFCLSIKEARKSCPFI
jgi:glutathione S-transferase